MASDTKQLIDQIIKENKQLKRSNRLLSVYVILSVVVMLYNYYGHLLF